MPGDAALHAASGPQLDVDWIWSDQPGRDRSPFNVPDFIDYRDSTRTLSGFAGFFACSANLSDEAAAERVQGIRATGNLFDVMGARARFGRLLQPGDERPGAEHVVVLAESFWTRRFGGDRAIIGRAIRLDGEEYTVVGVLAAGFAMPVRDVEVVLPFAADRDPRRGARNSLNFIIGVGRLREHVSLPQAASELTAIARRLQERFPVENARKRGVRTIGLIDGIVGPFRTALLTVFAAVGAFLLIACANLANLMPTRATSRRKDLAVRLALGSSRLNVVRQVLLEALLALKRGRTFSERDTDRTRAVAVVNEELAREWLQGLEPIGARLLVDDNDGPPRPVEIIGVVGNVQQMALDGPPTWDLYLTYPQIHPDNVGTAAANMFWIVRTTGEPMSLATTLTREVRRLDPEVVAAQIRPLDRYLSDAVAPRRFSLLLMAAFAAAALALATTGIYAVVAYSVSQRAREVGIRIALGASRSSIVRLVVGHGIRFVLIGLAAGTAAAVGATRLLSTMLFGLAATDAATFGQVVSVVAAISVVACAAPTARVGRLVVSDLNAE